MGNRQFCSSGHARNQSPVTPTSPLPDAPTSPSPDAPTSPSPDAPTSTSSDAPTSSQGNQDCTSLTVRQVNGEEFILQDIKSNEMIFKLKDQIRQKKGIPQHLQQLVHGLTQLQKSCALSDYDISANATLPLVTQRRIEPAHIEPLPLIEQGGSGDHWSTSSTPFDDSDFLRSLLQDNPTAELANVTLYCSEGCVKGISCRYQTEAGIIDAPVHNQRGYSYYSDHWPPCAPAVLDMEPGERIVRVHAQTGYILDRLELHTDRGKSVIAGGTGGGDRNVDIEPGSHVFGFSGHRTGGVMVRVGFYVM